MAELHLKFYHSLQKHFLQIIENKSIVAISSLISRAYMALKISVASITSTKMKLSLVSMTSIASQASKIKNYLYFTYWVIFLTSGTSAASMTSTASTTSVASMTSTASFYQKTFNSKKNIYFWWFVTLYYLKKASKSQNTDKKNYPRCFANWTIDGAQHQFNKNWLYRQNIVALSNT